jgi:hypothetical protein
MPEYTVQSNQEAIRTRELPPVTLGRTTYTVTEHYYVDGRYPASTYLTGPRGALYYLRPFLGPETGLRQVISMGSGNELRVRGNAVRVWHIGDVIETTKPVI